MTRINAGVKPAELSNLMLFAEYREIKRIPNAIKQGKAIIKNLPGDFRLGPGHVKFFYDKVYYLKRRFLKLREELYKRGYNITDYSEAFEGIPSHLMNDWEPGEYERQLIIDRIKSKMDGTFNQ